MKFTPLRRKTPLKPGGPLKRTPMKRTAIKPHAHPDPLSGTERSHVINRDRACIAFILYREGKVAFDTCRDTWGNYMSPDNLLLLTYEHTKPNAAMGMRAPSADGVGRRWGVACCPRHQDGWTSKHRALIREHLARLEAEGRL